jgi:hypothetical protein
MQESLIRAIASLALLLGSWNAAVASPVTYDWTSGSVTLFATTGGPNLLSSPSNVIALTSTSQVTFDSAVPSVTNFLFADASSSSTFGATAFSGAAAVLNGGQMVLSNVTIAPGAGYSSSGAGTNPYNITMNNLSASGNYQLKNAGGTTLFSGTFSNVVTPTLTGQVLLGGPGANQLALNGISLGAVRIGATDLLVKADVLFNGATPVPLPAGVWLLGSGMAGLMAWRRRRSARVDDTIEFDVREGSLGS